MGLDDDEWRRVPVCSPLPRLPTDESLRGCQGHHKNGKMRTKRGKGILFSFSSYSVWASKMYFAWEQYLQGNPLLPSLASILFRRYLMCDRILNGRGTGDGTFSKNKLVRQSPPPTQVKGRLCPSRYYQGPIYPTSARTAC